MRAGERRHTNEAREEEAILLALGLDDHNGANIGVLFLRFIITNTINNLPPFSLQPDIQLVLGGDRPIETTDATVGARNPEHTVVYGEGMLWM